MCVLYLCNGLSFVFCISNSLIMRRFSLCARWFLFAASELFELEKKRRDGTLGSSFSQNFFSSFLTSARVSLLSSGYSSCIGECIPREKLNEYSGPSSHVYIQPLLVCKDVNDRATSIRLPLFLLASLVCDRKTGGLYY